MNGYGVAFDIAAERWAVLADEHERLHHERGDECTGVGPCTLAKAVFDRREDALAELNVWRRIR